MNLAPEWSQADTIGLLFDNFGPYHFARLRGAQKVLGERRVTGLQIRDRSTEYAWQSLRSEASNLGLQTIFPFEESRPRTIQKIYYVWRHLNRLNPKAVAIAGYAAIEMLAALFWCRWHRRTAVLLSQSKEDDASRRWWKEWVKGVLVRRYDSALVGGRPQRRYIERLGMPIEAIFTRINVVGNQDYHPDRIAKLPRPLDKPFFLLANRFVPKKNLIFVLECYAEYQRQLVEVAERPWELVMAGDGPLRDELKARVLALGLQEVMHFPGFLQQPNLLPYLAHCEVFIHASTTEQWGLVVNEAMAAGRPVFVSRRCGCFEDLVIEGTTGLGFDPFNQDELVELMVRATKGELPLASLCANALTHITQFSPITFGQALGEAVECGLKHAQRRQRQN